MLSLRLKRYSCIKEQTSRFQIFFFNDTATTEIYTLSLHDALPIWGTESSGCFEGKFKKELLFSVVEMSSSSACRRSEEHTSELQSHVNLVCRLLLEKNKSKTTRSPYATSNTPIVSTSRT